MITSKSNQYLKLYVELQKKKFRHEYGLFPAEGCRLIEDLIKSGLKPHLLLYSSSFRDIGFLEEICPQSDYSFMVEDTLFHKISETKNEQGILAAFPLLCPNFDIFMKKHNGFLFILNQIQDPGNLGTIIRSSAGAGVSAVILEEGSVDLYNPKVIRSTMGAISKIPVFYQLSKEEIIAALKKNNYTIYLSDAHGDLPYWELPIDRNVAVVLGNEGNGIDEEWKSINCKKVYIPQQNDIESLNVAMAGGIIAFDFQRKSLK